MQVEGKEKRDQVYATLGWYKGKNKLCCEVSTFFPPNSQGFIFFLI